MPFPCSPPMARKALIFFSDLVPASLLWEFIRNSFQTLLPKCKLGPPSVVDLCCHCTSQDPWLLLFINLSVPVDCMFLKVRVRVLFMFIFPVLSRVTMLYIQGSGTCSLAHRKHLQRLLKRRLLGPAFRTSSGEKDRAGCRMMRICISYKAPGDGGAAELGFTL